MRFKATKIAVGGFRPHLQRPRGEGGVPEDKEKENKNLQSLLAKYNGDAMALAAQLLGENADLRGERRALRADLSSLGGKAVPDGHVAIPAEKAEQLKAYEALGAVDVLKTTVAEAGTLKADKEKLEGENTELKAKATRAERNEKLRGIAEVSGFKFSVFADQDARTPGLDYELKEVDENGKKIKKAFVRYKDGDGENAPVKEVALADFANDKWSDYLPALRVDPAAQGAKGTPHVAQGGSANGGTGSVFDRIRSAQEAKSKASETTGPSLEQRLNMRPAGTAPAV